jgi:hypothetical protein
MLSWRLHYCSQETDNNTGKAVLTFTFDHGSDFGDIKMLHFMDQAKEQTVLVHNGMDVIDPSKEHCKDFAWKPFLDVQKHLSREYKHDSLPPFKVLFSYVRERNEWAVENLCKNYFIIVPSAEDDARGVQRLESGDKSVVANNDTVVLATSKSEPDWETMIQYRHVLTAKIKLPKALT